MSFASGTRLSHFEITAPIGSGGMGDVYKARDTRLDRTVANKVLQTAVRTKLPVSASPYRQQYAPSPDGQRFLINRAPDDTPPGAIHVVLDWRSLLASLEK